MKRKFFSLFCISLCISLFALTNDNDRYKVTLNLEYKGPIPANAVQIWPPDSVDDISNMLKKGIALGINHIFQFGPRYQDTILIVGSVADLSSNPKYDFDSYPDIVEAFPNSKITTYFYKGDPPQCVEVDSEYGDSLLFVGSYFNNFTISDGIIKSNSLISLPKGFRPGSTINEFERYVGLKGLNLTLPDTPYLTVILDSWGLPRFGYYQGRLVKYTFDIWCGVIVRIKINDWPPYM